MKRKLFTPALLNQKAPASGREEVRDSGSHLILRRSTTARSFIVRTRIRGEAQPIRLTYPGAACVEELTDARKWAAEIIGQCRRGVDPRENVRARSKGKFETIAEDFLKLHASKLKSSEDIERVFHQELIPAFGKRQIQDITRADVARLLDRIASRTRTRKDGTVVTMEKRADRVLAYLRKFFHWYEGRDHEFRSPIVSGMARTKPTSRDRTLTDEEIRLIWDSSRAPLAIF